MNCYVYSVYYFTKLIERTIIRTVLKKVEDPNKLSVESVLTLKTRCFYKFVSLLSLLEMCSCFPMLERFQKYSKNDYLNLNNSETISEVCSN